MRTLEKYFLNFGNCLLPGLEETVNKLIGKSLEAKVQLFGHEREHSDRIIQQNDFMEAWVSFSMSLNWRLSRQSRFQFGFSHVDADGQKCERCWHWETDVGSNPEHPTICGRCVAAVKEFAAK